MIDVDTYTEENIKVLLDCKREIISYLGNGKTPTDTLVSKIMLGIFANVPAFDTFFRNGLKTHSFGRKSLKYINEFYNENYEVIDKYHNQIFTFDFNTGKETERKYTRAKIIDMIGFIEGTNL